MGKLSQKEILLLAQGHIIYENQSHNSDCTGGNMYGEQFL